MNPSRLFRIPPLFLMAIALANSGGQRARAAVITLTGGDAADASDSIGYAPAANVKYAYRIIAPNGTNGVTVDQLAHTYNGVTFQPFNMNGTVSAPSANVTTHGTVTITNGFFYPAGALLNAGTGGGGISANDTALFDIAKYQSFAASSYSGNHGTQTLTLGGLIYQQVYQIDLFVANSHGAAEYLYTTTGDGSPLPTESVIPTNGLVAGRAYDLRQTVAADINGEIRVVFTDNLAQANDNATVNAFSVTFVPEPGSIALTAIGALMIGRRR